MVVAIQLTPLGWAILPFVIIAICAFAAAVVVYRRREMRLGFDIGEAANYVWSGLTREQRSRIAFGHVVAMLEAEARLPGETDDAVLFQCLTDAAIDVGADVTDGDIESVIELQIAYAEAKGAM